MDLLLPKSLSSDRKNGVLHLRRGVFEKFRLRDWRNCRSALKMEEITPEQTLPSLTKHKKTTGLRYWMERVPEECERVSTEFKADPVHDLRVALRRCRSMADGLSAIDPDPDWKAMKKAGKKLFQRLGDLRDVQVMMEWIERLNPAPVRVEGGDSPAPEQPESSSKSVTGEGNPQDTRDSVAEALLRILRDRENDHKQEARVALEEFDPKQWRQWSRSLPLRAARIRPGSLVLKHLALERWMHARELHVIAMRNRSQVALHTLRIGVKRFRYIVENFLPEQNEAWGKSLKEIQDLLGEIHDLDVLWATALTCRVFADAEARTRWHARIREERTKRVEAYREKMLGPDSLWQVWRAGLPQGKQVRMIATQRMKLWAKALDPDFKHSEHISRLALQLYDALAKAELLKPANESTARETLSVAALLHDVGKSKGKKGHHKHSFELIREHGTPLGWNPAEMQRAAIVARFHSGALPTRSHKTLRDLLPEEQKLTIQLAAVLRLANALDSEHDGQVRRVLIENRQARNVQGANRGSHGFLRKSPNGLGKGEAVIIEAEGFTAGSSTARTVAAERYLLETVLRRPVVVRPLTIPRNPPRLNSISHFRVRSLQG